MSVLLLRLEGPMQSWGINSKFSERMTESEPTKSGVIGLICSALGRKRHEDIKDLTSLKMGVRIEREGTITYDYHTVLGVLKAKAKGNPTPSKRGNVVSRRYYLSDACFLVGLEGKDEKLLQNIKESLKSPRWPLFLGRKSFLPSSPLLLEQNLIEKPLLEILTNYRWLGRDPKNAPSMLRLITETTPSEGEPKLDVPLSFKERTFRTRFIATTFIPFENLEEEK